MPRHLIAFALAVLMVLPAVPARATILVPADVTELSRGAALIVRGTVTAATPQWADGRRRIETVVTLEIRQVLKGDVGTTVSFKVPGGNMGRYRSVMVGAPTFTPGEEVVLFLGARPPSLPYLLGLGQGVYRVQRDSRTGEARVVSPALFAQPDRNVTVRRGEAGRLLSVNEFAAQVRQALAGSDKERRSPGGLAGGNRGR